MKFVSSCINFKRKYNDGGFKYSVRNKSWCKMEEEKEKEEEELGKEAAAQRRPSPGGI